MVVVTPDARVAALAQSRGATVVPEPGAERAERGRGERHRLCAARAASARPWCCRPTFPSPRRPSCASLIASRGVAARRDARALARQQRHQRPAARPAQRHRALLWAGQLSAALSQAMARRIDVNVVHLAGPRPRHRRAGRPRRCLLGGGRQRAMPFSRPTSPPARHCRITAAQRRSNDDVRHPQRARGCRGRARACRASRRWRSPSATTSPAHCRWPRSSASPATART